MAKRMKLDSALGSLVRSVEVQDMLNIPEAKKLYELDKEMKDILVDEKLEVSEKVRKYERTLAAYRHAQNRIIANGGLSMVNVDQNVDDESSDASIVDGKNVIKELILQIIKEANDKVLVNAAGQLQPSSNMLGQPAPSSNALLVQSVQSSNIPGPSLPASNVPGPSTPSTSRVVTVPILHEVASTPKNVRRTGENTSSTPVRSVDDASYATPSADADEQTPMAQVLQTLQQHGILSINGEDVSAQVLSTNTQYKRKPSGRSHQMIFKTKTYRKALDHLMSGAVQKTPPQTKGMISIIYDGLRDKMPNFETFINNYPNLRQYHEKNAVLDLSSLPWAMMK